jgi:predicted nuclease of predicted toxin-antitoxin system
MKFLLDHDVYLATAVFLKKLGHDVKRVSELGLATAQDTNLLDTARAMGRLFITRDRDFGSLVFVNHKDVAVLYLRTSPSTVESTHNELAMVLSEHSEAELYNSFVVIEPGGHRIRKLK